MAGAVPSDGNGENPGKILPARYLAYGARIRRPWTRNVHPILVAAILTESVLAALLAWSYGPRSGPDGPGLDYSIMIWGPVRGLVAGYDVYDPLAHGYLAQFDILRPATLHAPSLLLMFGWTAFFSVRVGYVVFVTLSAIALGTAIVAVLPAPIGYGGILVTIGLVVVVVEASAPSDAVIFLGQVTALVALGAVLAVQGRSAKTVALGVVLMSISPQTAIPITLLLVLLGRRSGLLLGWAVTILASLPALIIAAVNAGGVGQLLRAMQRGSKELVDAYRIDIPHLLYPDSRVSGPAVGLAIMA
jgi:hypothetical protein